MLLPQFNFKTSFKTAIKDTVDVGMFLIALVISYLDLFTTMKFHGAVGFLTFYLFFLLLRLGYYKNIINNL